MCQELNGLKIKNECNNNLQVQDLKEEWIDEIVI